MKRHESLQPLSRDHYVGLVQAKHLQEAADKGDAARREAAGEFLRAWDTEIADHFAVEEALLLPHLGDAAEAKRLIEEHADLRSLAAALRAENEAPAGEALRHLGTRLHDHIRWEERVLFPLLERTLGEEGLASLEAPLQEVEARRSRAAVGYPPRRVDCNDISAMG